MKYVAITEFLWYKRKDIVRAEDYEHLDSWLKDGKIEIKYESAELIPKADSPYVPKPIEPILDALPEDKVEEMPKKKRNLTNLFRGK